MFKNHIVAVSGLMLTGCSFSLWSNECDPQGPPTFTTTTTTVDTVDTWLTTTTTTVETVDTAEECLDNGEYSKSNWSQVSAGGSHSCVLDAEASISCWGDEAAYDGYPSGYDGFWSEVEAGYGFTCATEDKADGIDQIKCWGGISAAGVAGFYEADNLSVGASHLCYLESDGTVVCDGSDEFGQSTPPKKFLASAVSAGVSATCALDTKTAAPVCWGSVAKDKKLVMNKLSWSDITVGLNLACGIATKSGQVECIDLQTLSFIPVPLDKKSVVSHLEAGEAGVCALDDAGAATCWDDTGAALKKMKGEYGSISPGKAHICAVEHVWGVKDEPKETGLTTSTTTTATTTTTTTDTGKSGPELVMLGDDLVCWGNDSDGEACPP